MYIIYICVYVYIYIYIVYTYIDPRAVMTLKMNYIF